MKNLTSFGFSMIVTICALGFAPLAQAGLSVNEEISCAGKDSKFRPVYFTLRRPTENTLCRIFGNYTPYRYREHENRCSTNHKVGSGAGFVPEYGDCDCNPYAKSNGSFSGEANFRETNDTETMPESTFTREDLLRDLEYPNRVYKFGSNADDFMIYVGEPDDDGRSLANLYRFEIDRNRIRSGTSWSRAMKCVWRPIADGK